MPKFGNSSARARFSIGCTAPLVALNCDVQDSSTTLGMTEGVRSIRQRTRCRIRSGMTGGQALGRNDRRAECRIRSDTDKMRDPGSVAGVTKGESLHQVRNDRMRHA